MEQIHSNSPSKVTKQGALFLQGLGRHADTAKNNIFLQIVRNRFDNHVKIGFVTLSLLSVYLYSSSKEGMFVVLVLLSALYFGHRRILKIQRKFILQHIYFNGLFIFLLRSFHSMLNPRNYLSCCVGIVWKTKTQCCSIWPVHFVYSLVASRSLFHLCLFLVFEFVGKCCCNRYCFLLCTMWLL